MGWCVLIELWRESIGIMKLEGGVVDCNIHDGVVYGRGEEGSIGCKGWALECMVKDEA